MTKKKAPKKNKGGRPSKFTDKAIDIIYDNIRIGMSIDASVRLAGLDPSTFYRWQATAKDQKAGKYKEFYKGLELAKAERERILVMRLHKTSQKGNSSDTKFLLVNGSEHWQFPNAKIDMTMDKDIVFKIERD